MRRLLLSCFLLSAVACGKDSPTAPTPTPAPTVTKVIRLTGNLAFGNVFVGGQPADLTLNVNNDGNANLNVTGVSGPCGGAAVTLIGSTSFAVGPAQTVPLTFRFRPTAIQSCSGTVTVSSDATSGTSTASITAVGVAPPRPNFTRTGTGDTVFDMPVDVARVRIIGIYEGRSSNFIVRIGGRLIVNELLGDSWGSRRYDGTLLTGGGGVVAITSSSGVQWSFEEIGR